MIELELVNKNVNLLALLKYFKVVPFETTVNTRLNCLFHESKSGISAEINYHNKLWCWSCGKAYSVIDIYQKITKYSFQKSILQLTKLLTNEDFKKNIILSSSTKEVIKNKTKRNHIKKNSTFSVSFEEFKTKYSPFLEKIKIFYHQQLLKNKFALNYLCQERKIKLSTIKKFQLGLALNNNQQLFCLLKNKMCEILNTALKLDLIKHSKNFYFDSLVDCLVIPVLNEGKVTHFFKHNYHLPITQYQPKYKALKKIIDIPIFYFPFGFSFAKETILKTKKMVVHEGFYDVINCHQHGIKNAVGIITVTNYFSDWMIKFLIE
ncbi:MAG: hypothetical protein Q8885_01415, partial [Candidatus Phytoplasma stylosanthis]|nr:hypothetical protein [Candidatus Phytoplasma stylosanthis]